MTKILHLNKRPYTQGLFVLILPYSLLLSACNQTKSNVTLVPNTENYITTSIDNVAAESTSSENQSESLEDSEKECILKLISFFKAKNIESISEKISYPLSREYPIPSIKNKAELKQRFQEVFDAFLVAKIANSKIEDWSEVGWRGIMLDNGDVWLGNSDGIITTVNYQSEFEKQRIVELIAEEKANLNESLKSFKRPTYKIETKQFFIRIDELANGTYRYASWKLGVPESSKPEIVLQNGSFEFSGSGGNHFITFENGKYTYTIQRILLGEDDSPAVRLIVTKDGNPILTQDGKLVLE